MRWRNSWSEIRRCSQLREEVINAYLLWELSRKTIRETLQTSPVNLDAITRCTDLAKEALSEVSENGKFKFAKLFSHGDQVRLFETMRWTRRDLPISELGTVLPYVGDLPPQVLARSFSDVVKYVRLNLGNMSKSMSIRYISDLSRIPKILESIPIIVIEPGNLQRRPDVMIQVQSWRPEWPIHQSKAYIEDGNHRALALALSDSQHTSIPCYVGVGNQ